jgi:hypothetical protein
MSYLALADLVDGVDKTTHRNFTTISSAYGASVDISALDAKRHASGRNTSRGEDQECRSALFGREMSWIN